MLSNYRPYLSVNPIGAMKTFGKPECTLCMKERLSILNFKRKRSIKVMNACSEIYGTCNHKTRFHRFARHWWSNFGERDFDFLKTLKTSKTSKEILIFKNFENLQITSKLESLFKKNYTTISDWQTRQETLLCNGPSPKWRPCS